MKQHLLKAGHLVVCIFVLTLPLAAQQSANLEQGLKPFGTYRGGNLDSVSMTNGNLTLHIPLVSYPQRGGKLRLDFFIRKSWAATRRHGKYTRPSGIRTPNAIETARLSTRS